jgi:hypothetical protein
MKTIVALVLGLSLAGSASAAPYAFLKKKGMHEHVTEKLEQKYAGQRVLKVKMLGSGAVRHREFVALTEARDGRRYINGTVDSASKTGRITATKIERSR